MSANEDADPTVTQQKAIALVKSHLEAAGFTVGIAGRHSDPTAAQRKASAMVKAPRAWNARDAMVAALNGATPAQLLERLGSAQQVADFEALTRRITDAANHGMEISGPVLLSCLSAAGIASGTASSSSACWEIPLVGAVVARRGSVSILAGGREWLLSPRDARALGATLGPAADEAERLLRG